MGKPDRRARGDRPPDGWDGYGKLADAGYEHRPRLQRRPKPNEQKLLPRAHRATSNLKTWL